jgi:DNA polymerase I-like protein with 3'-5' exonuclease and polymerase domains
LNDHRKQFNVGVLIKEYLDETPMDRVDESRMAEYHAGQVAPRSEYGVRKIRELRDKMWPLIDAEELQDVRQLEDDCIHAVVEMEENGAPIDVGLLEQWQTQIRAEINQLRDEVSRVVGIATQDSLFGEGDAPVSYFNPDSGKDMELLFNRLGLPIERTETGRGRFNADAMAQYHEHPVLSKIVRQGKLLDLESKYIHPYLAHVNGQNILRYELHQMRGDENGTVRGRFASARVNIQQVLKPSKQAKNYGPGYVVRSLFLPAPGRIFVSGDAEQIEYRIFAHYANNLRVFAEYAKNPWLNFHKLTEAMICKLGFDIDYDKAKQLNFLTIYGGGLLKLALQLGTISSAQHRELTLKYSDRDKYPFGPPREHPYLRNTVRVQEAYRKALPEARSLSRRCTDVAKDRGYVKDFIGRRARFPGGYEAHGALNAVIQPGAAEVMKRKMVEVHRRRKEIGVTPRMTIHDDWLGDCADDDAAYRLQDLLNEQSFPFKVPIIWNVKRGPRWSECKDLEKHNRIKDPGEFAGTVKDITRDGRDRA